MSEYAPKYSAAQYTAAQVAALFYAERRRTVDEYSAALATEGALRSAERALADQEAYSVRLLNRIEEYQAAQADHVEEIARLTAQAHDPPACPHAMSPAPDAGPPCSACSLAGTHGCGVGAAADSLSRAALKRQAAEYREERDRERRVSDGLRAELADLRQSFGVMEQMHDAQRQRAERAERAEAEAEAKADRAPPPADRGEGEDEDEDAWYHHTCGECVLFGTDGCDATVSGAMGACAGFWPRVEQRKNTLDPYRGGRSARRGE